MIMKSQRMKDFIRRWVGGAKIVIGYVAADNAKDKRFFAIGFLTVFMVAVFLGLIQTILLRAASIFVKISEDSVGQFDIVVIPSVKDGVQTYTVNFTDIEQKVMKSTSNFDLVAGMAPRWALPGVIKRIPSTITSNSTGNTTVSSTMVDSGLTGFFGRNKPEPVVKNKTILILAMDSELEKAIGIGSAWPYRTLGKNEVSVTASVLRSLKVRPNIGDRVILSLQVEDVLNALGSDYNVAQYLNNTSNVALDVLAPSGNITITPRNLDDLDLTSDQRRQIEDQLQKDSNGNFYINTTRININSSEPLPPIEVEFSVVDAIEYPFGKYPVALGDVVVVDAYYVQDLINNAVDIYLGANPLFRIALLQGGGTAGFGVSINIYEYCLNVIMAKKDRLTTYVKDAIGRKFDLVQFSNQLAQILGPTYPVNYVDVLNQALVNTGFIQIFLGEIFFTVIVILSGLAIILIYSLLLSNVEEKTFEYGMLRSLGMNKIALISLLVFQALYFSLPGLFLGLLTCYILYVPIDYFLSKFASILLDPTIPSVSLILACSMGLFLPIAGVLIPIRRALTKTLRDALDLFHLVIYETSVSMQKLQDIGLSLAQTAVAIILIVIGFLVYYVVPLAFAFNNLALFFRVLTIILLGMVVGQVLVGQLFHHVIEKGATFLLLWSSDRKLRHLVAKNLASHLRRNRRAALMFTLCLAYVSFASTMFALQSKSLADGISWINGADVAVLGSSFRVPLPEQELRALLESMMKANATLGQEKIVEAFTFITYPLNKYSAVKSSTLKGLVTLKSSTVEVYGIEPNFLDAALQPYFIPAQVNSELQSYERANWNTQDLIERLFEPLNPLQLKGADEPFASVLSRNVLSQRKDVEFEAMKLKYITAFPVLISDRITQRNYMAPTQLLQLRNTVESRRGDTVNPDHLCVIVSTLKKSPAFTYISRLFTSQTPVIMAMSNYRQLLMEAFTLSNITLPDTLTIRSSSTLTQFNMTSYTTTQEIESNLLVPKGKLLIRVSPSAGSRQIELLVDQLATLIQDDNVQILNLKSTIATTTQAVQYIDLMFVIVALVGMILCFFVLWLSFNSNMRENSWEFGVLRALGLNSFTVTRLYLYEALCIMTACIITGTLTGIVTSITLSLQFNLFSELPFTFTMPTTLFTLLILLSIAVSLIASYLPASDYADRKIAVVLKGGGSG